MCQNEKKNAKENNTIDVLEIGKKCSLGSNFGPQMKFSEKKRALHESS